MDIYIIESRPVKTLTPVGYYRKKCEAYTAELGAKYNRGHFIPGVYHACDAVAREMYSQITGRSSRVTDLATNKEEAEQLFEYFKIYANVWAYQVAGEAGRTISGKELQIKRIAEVLHSADAEQLKELDVFVRTYIQQAH